MADIILKNKQGEEVILRNKTKLTAENTSGGTEEFIQPSGTQTISANGTYDIKNKASVAVAVPTVTPTGKLNITDMNVKDVTNYAQAQVVDDNLIEANIKRGVSILGKTGTYEGSGGGGGPSHYVTFTAAEANSSVKLTTNGSITGLTVFYSTDNTNWIRYTIGTVINLSAIGDYVSFYGVGNWICNFSSSNYMTFVMTGKINGSGDCNALLDSETDGTVAYCFYCLFKDCASLVTAPELPSMTILGHCYENMFIRCSSLVTAPDLPATTLATFCYGTMFLGCASLTTAPELPATTLASSCYTYMFCNCSSLVTAPDLPATTLVGSCYGYMFEGCTSLVTPPEMHATTISTYCCQHMFYGCTSLATAPELPAKTLANYCYDSMFYGCTSLATAPELPATALVTSCYSQMFRNCTSLTSVKTAIKTWSTTNAGSWLTGVASSGTVYCPSNSTIPSNNSSGIPTGWSRENWPAA